MKITYEQKVKLIDEILEQMYTYLRDNFSVNNETSKSILFNKTIMGAIKEDIYILEDLEN